MRPGGNNSSPPYGVAAESCLALLGPCVLHASQGPTAISDSGSAEQSIDAAKHEPINPTACPHAQEPEKREIRRRDDLRRAGWQRAQLRSAQRVSSDGQRQTLSVHCERAAAISGADKFPAKPWEPELRSCARRAAS